MGEAPKPVFTLQDATVDDAQDMAGIFLRGLSWDPISKEFDKVMPFEVGRELVMQREHGRLTVGHELGASRTWKVVDENGKMVAWGGLGIPVSLTEDQKLAIKGDFSIPPDIKFPEGLMKYIESVEEKYDKALQRNGYDPELHFARQGTMVDIPYQRKGIGKMITRKCNEIADEAGKSTFVKARPTSKHLFEQEGYTLLEEISMDYEDFGYEGGSAVYVMEREPGGK